MQRNFVRQGFGLFSDQDRNRFEFAARFQNIWGKHTFKYGFEWNDNIYKIDTISTGPDLNFADPRRPSGSGTNTGLSIRFTDLCASQIGTQRSLARAPRCTAHVQLLDQCWPALAGTGITHRCRPTLRCRSIARPIRSWFSTSFVFVTSASIRDGEFTNTTTESFYIQDDWKVTRNLQINLGLRWDLPAGLLAGWRRPT